MTLPTSGNISMSMVAQELGISAAGLNLNDSRVRGLAGRPSGSISMADLRGKSAYTPMSLGLHSNENGSVMAWYPTSTGRVSAYIYNCGITAIISGGVAPYTCVFTKSNSFGVLTSNGIYANWAVPIPRFAGEGYVVSSNFTCVVTDSTNRQMSITVAGILEVVG